MKFIMVNNIEHIHEEIMNQFKREESLVPSLQKRLHELNHIYTLHPSDELKLEIEEFEKNLNYTCSHERKNFYILNIIPLIEEYKKELNKPIEIDFFTMEEKVNYRIQEINDEFMKRITFFFPNLAQHSKFNDTCDYCDSSNINTVDNVCIDCGTEKDILQLSFTYNDVDRINISSKYTYNRKIHFKECIDQFQGKQNINIDKDLYEKLNEQLVLHGLVQQGDFPKTIKYGKITKNDIMYFLKKIGASKHYKDVNLIYHNVTGAELHDISHLEEALLDDFTILNELYNERYIKPKKIQRKNFINTQEVLYQLLRKHGYPCSKQDFNLLKTAEKKNFHDKICSDLFKQLEWNFFD